MEHSPRPAEGMWGVVFDPQRANGRVRYERLDVPSVDGSGVLVRVAHSALNHRDCLIARGNYLPDAPRSVMGSDGAGLVVEVGEGCPWTVGDPVVINPVLQWGNEQRIPNRKTIRTLGVPDDGTFAEYIRLPAHSLARAPQHLTQAQAAALPLAGLTAYRALFTRGGLQAGETVIITGIGGGVSQIALQMALAAGARVFVTSRSQENIDTAMTQGADGGVVTGEDGWDRALRKRAGHVNLVIDSVGGADFSRLPGLCVEGGRIVVFGALAGESTELAIPMLFYKQLDIRGTSVGSPADFASMLDFVDRHGIQPAVAAEFPLSRCAEAIEYLMGQRPVGKVVLNNVPD